MLRRPAPAELAGRRPIALTRRDVEVLAAVHAHGVLTAGHIALAFFPGPAGPPAGPDRSGMPTANCYVRLRLLWLWGYLERLEQLVPRGFRGSRPALYALGPRGAAPFAGVAGRDGAAAPRVGRLRADRLAGRSLEHDLVAADFWAHLCALLRAAPAPVVGWRWTGERELRARGLRLRDPRTGRRLPFLPDGYFEVEYAPEAARSESVAAGEGAPSCYGGPAPAGNRGAPADVGAGRPLQCAVLEVDRGTLSTPRFRRKARAFELALGSGLFARHFGRPEFEVLVVTTDEARLRRLWAAARREVPEARWAWWSFATLEALHPARFAGRPWLTLDGQRTPLLYDASGGV